MKAERKKNVEDLWEGQRKVFVPNALPMFYDEPESLRKEKEEKELAKKDVNKYGNNF